MKNSIQHTRQLDIPYGLVWTDFTSTSQVQQVIAEGIVAKCDCMLLRRTGAMIKSYRAGTGTNYLRSFIDQCKANNIKPGLIMEPTKNDTSGRYTDTQITETVITTFIDMLRWVLQTYPDLYSIEFEEPHFWNPVPADGGAARRTTLNNYFTRINTTVRQYRSDLLLGFNTARMGNLQGSGIDTGYIRDNDIFDYYAPQNYYLSLGNESTTNTYRWYIQYVTNFFGNMPQIPWTTTRNYDEPTFSTYNPGLYDEVKYMSSNRKPHGIFWNGDLNVSANSSGWSADLTPGTDCKSKLGNISITTCPSPSFNYNIKEI